LREKVREFKIDEGGFRTAKDVIEDTVGFEITL
jgi:hypothetical protein